MCLCRRLARQICHGASSTVAASARAVSVASNRPCASISFSLFDYFVRDREHARWNRQTERLGGLEVDHEFKLGRLRDRQIGGLLAFQNAADIDARLPIGVR